MIDLLQATEFIKMPNGKYLNKLSNGIEYSETELKALLKKNNKEVMEKANELESETTKTNKRHKSTKRSRN